MSDGVEIETLWYHIPWIRAEYTYAQKEDHSKVATLIYSTIKLKLSMILFLLAIAFIGSAYCELDETRRRGTSGGVVGKPLFLTPYIEEGKIAEGRKAAEVRPLMDNIVSYSGFLTVNKTLESNLFFWFFPAETTPETAPVALWLQGGPGCSSVMAVFDENGPFFFKKGPEVGHKRHYWSQNLNVIYIDQPVGTGFSFTKSTEGYAKDEEQIGLQLYSALLQFFQLFPEYTTNDFILTGESYAGKYIPVLAYVIHNFNPMVNQKINLKGVAIGDGWVDPLNMIDYGNLLYSMGFIDLQTKDKFQDTEMNIKYLITQQKYREAQDAMDAYFDDNDALATNITGLVNVYNFLLQTPDDDSILEKYLRRHDVRRRIHVGNLEFEDCSDEVYNNLYEDNLKSVLPLLEVIMDNYRVLLYNGQLDIICAYPLTMNYVRKLRWKGADEYANATRKKWFVQGQLAGFSKSAGNFTELLVLNAGHMVPRDQPLRALEMITKFANNEPL